MKIWIVVKFWWHFGLPAKYNLWMIFLKIPKNIQLLNLVAKQVLTERKIKFDPEGSNIKVWIGISSFLSHGVTCINVILWFHKSRSSFYPWGSFGNLKHGSTVAGYKFKSACTITGVKKKNKWTADIYSSLITIRTVRRFLEGRNKGVRAHKSKYFETILLTYKYIWISDNAKSGMEYVFR